MIYIIVGNQEEGKGGSDFGVEGKQGIYPGVVSG
jgi:hypothetical protein